MRLAGRGRTTTIRRRMTTRTTASMMRTVTTTTRNRQVEKRPLYGTLRTAKKSRPTVFGPLRLFRLLSFRKARRVTSEATGAQGKLLDVKGRGKDA